MEWGHLNEDLSFLFVRFKADLHSLKEIAIEQKKTNFRWSERNFLRNQKITNALILFVGGCKQTKKIVFAFYVSITYAVRLFMVEGNIFQC